MEVINEFTKGYQQLAL